MQDLYRMSCFSTVYGGSFSIVMTAFGNIAERCYCIANGACNL